MKFLKSESVRIALLIGVYFVLCGHVFAAQKPMYLQCVFAPIETVKTQQNGQLNPITNDQQHFILKRNASSGSRVYSDRNYVYKQLPGFLQGKDYLIMKNADKASKASVLFRYPCSGSVEVYVGIDARLNSVPAWMVRQGYVDTKKTLTISQSGNNPPSKLKIFRRTIDNKGNHNIVFGGNLNKVRKQNVNMYVVFLAPKSVTSTVVLETGSTSTSIPASALESASISTSASHFTLKSNVRSGSKVYSDRDYVYKQLPGFLQGKDYLIMKNADKFSKGSSLFQCSYSGGVEVYVGIDARLKSIPAWLVQQGYVDTKTTLTISQGANNRIGFKVFKKVINKKGKHSISFGGNLNENNKQNVNMYVVFLAKKSTTSTPASALESTPVSASRFTLESDVRNGSKVYTDRNYIYQQLPYFLQGKDYLITRNEDKSSTGDHLFEVLYSDSVIVYVGVDKQLQSEPVWLLQQGYINTYKTVTVKIPGGSDNFVRFNLFKKEIKKSGDHRIIFGGNLNQGNQQEVNMYVVFLDNEVERPSITIQSRSNTSATLTGWAQINVVRGEDVPKSHEDTRVAHDTVDNNMPNEICVQEKRHLNSSTGVQYMLDDTRQDVLFPGNILLASDIECGKYRSAQVPERNTYRISTDIRGLTHSATAWVENSAGHNPGYGDYLNATTRLLSKHNFSNEIGTRVAWGNFKTTASEVDFIMEVSADISMLAHNGRGDFAYAKSKKKNHYTTDIEKKYYTIVCEYPKQVFKDSVAIDMNPDWLYVKSVSYGTRLILNIESNYDADSVNAALQYRYNKLSADMGAELNVEYENVLDDLEISVIALGEQPEQLEKLIKNPDNESFAGVFTGKADANTQLVPLSYELRFLDDNSLAAIKTHAEYTQQLCINLKQPKILQVEIKDICVVEADDAYGGEELYGQVVLAVPNHDTLVVFEKGEEQAFTNDAPSGYMHPINKFYYFKYNSSDIKNPENKIVVKADIKEDDTWLAFGDDNLGSKYHEYGLGRLIVDSESNRHLQAEEMKDAGWAESNEIKCPDCRVLLFSDGNSKVMVRYKLTVRDELPSGAKLGR